ncbi:MAG: cell division protein SepF [Collinsella sp.]
MGFLDEIKNKMHLGGQQGYDRVMARTTTTATMMAMTMAIRATATAVLRARASTPRRAEQRLLGQTRRGEAGVGCRVYTPGQLVGDDSRHATTYNPPSRSQDSVASGYRPGAYDTPSSYAENTRARAAAACACTERCLGYASNIINAHRSCRPMSCAPRAMTTWRPWCAAFAQAACRTDFVGVRTEVAKRVLGFLTALPAVWVPRSRVGDRVFMVLPAGCEVKDSDLKKLRADGYLSKDKTRRFPSTSTLSSSWSIRCSTSIPRSLSSTAL